MDWINFHHLRYFWTVAKEGSISRACHELRLAQPTISAQLRSLEDSLGAKLFVRSGRGLQLTEVGEVAFRYADQIFALGQELKDAVRGDVTRNTLTVGIADVVPKVVIYKLLEPARHLAEPVQLICREGRPENLFADLAVHRLDVVLTDAPIGSNVKVKAYNHLLGECGISFFAPAKLATRYRKNFPQSLHQAPLLLPSDESATRLALDAWFERLAIKPQIIGEFSDSALLRAFGEAGDGIFPLPSVVEGDLAKESSIKLLGRAEGLVERYYAISTERKLRHPAVVAISEAAKLTVFGELAE